MARAARLPAHSRRASPPRVPRSCLFLRQCRAAPSSPALRPVDCFENCLAFLCQQSDGCEDRAERGTKEIQNENVHHRQREQHQRVRHPRGGRRCNRNPVGGAPLRRAPGRRRAATSPGCRRAACTAAAVAPGDTFRAPEFRGYAWPPPPAGGWGARRAERAAAVVGTY